MANTRYTFTPAGAVFPATAFPELKLNAQRHMVLAFDDTTQETCYFQAAAPQGLTGTLNAVLYGIMASATTGSVYVEVALEAVTPADATDLDAGTSFAAANSGNGTVPGTAGYLFAITVTLTNADSIAAGDYFRLSVARDADNASDTATGDWQLLAVELRDNA